MTESDILSYIASDEWMLRILQIVESLHLPDWWIGAGFVRNRIWDLLHSYPYHTPLNDIDVIYFDSELLSEDFEKQLEGMLSQQDGSIKWSVKNQARMAGVRGDGPYINAADGLSRWVETATCIGVKLDQSGQLLLTAPYGIGDLIHLYLRFNEFSRLDRSIFDKRIAEKNWLTIWPKLQVIT